VVELLHGAQSATGVREQGNAGRGELDPPQTALEQFGADHCLQPPKPLGERRLSDPDNARRVAEVLLISQRHENLQISLSQHDPPDLR
jgi:hypothetical protein